MSHSLRKISVSLLLASLLLCFSPRLSYGGGCGPGGAGYLCAPPDAYSDAGGNFIRGVEKVKGWLARLYEWYWPNELGRLSPGEQLAKDIGLGLFAEEGLLLATFGVTGAGPGIKTVMGNSPQPSFNPIAMGEMRLVPSTRLRASLAHPESLSERNLFGQIQLPATPAPAVQAANTAERLLARTGVQVQYASEHYQIISQGGERFIEFRANRAYLPELFVNPQGRPTSMAGATVTPSGEVLLVEGRHRGIAAAAGDVIPENLGGIPAMPGWLRYEYWEFTSQRVQSMFRLMGTPRPTLVPMISAARSPTLLGIARSARSADLTNPAVRGLLLNR